MKPLSSGNGVLHFSGSRSEELRCSIATELGQNLYEQEHEVMEQA